MDLLPVFVSLGSAAFGYFVKAFVDSKMEDKKQKEKEKQFKREKLENLYILLDEFTEYTVEFYSSLFVHLYANENIDEFKKRFEKINMQYLGNYRKIKVIFALYFYNDLKNEYKTMEHIQNNLSGHLSKYIEKILDADKDDLSQKIKQDISEWTTFMDEFENKLPNLIKKIH